MDFLPVEVVAYITQHLPVKDLAACCAVSRQWRYLFSSDVVWQPHCDSNLFKYLRSTPCMVEPPYTSPETETSTLSTIGYWREAYLRENHLWSNWCKGKFKKNVFNVKNNSFNCEFFTNDSLLIWDRDQITLWDVSHHKAEFVAETNFITPYGINVLVKNNIVIIVNFSCVQVYNVDLSTKSFNSKCLFLFDDDHKIDTDNVVEVVKRKIEGMDGIGYFPAYTVVGTVFLAFFEGKSTEVHVWDIESGLKFKAISSPLCKQGVFVDLKASETSENIVFVVAFYEKADDAKKAMETGGRPQHVNAKEYCFFIFNSKTHNFLSFKKQSRIYSPSIAIHENYFGFYDGISVNIYNYETSDNILQLCVKFTRSTHFSKIDVIKDGFVFLNRGLLHVFYPKSKSLVQHSNALIYNFKCVKRNFIKLFRVNKLESEIWRVGESVEKTNLNFPVFYKINPAGSRVVVKEYMEREGYQEEMFSLLNFW